MIRCIGEIKESPQGFFVFVFLFVLFFVVVFCLLLFCCVVSLAEAATSIIFVATKHVFCSNKSMLAATKL